jgi:hypothetical protein
VRINSAVSLTYVKFLILRKWFRFVHIIIKTRMRKADWNDACSLAASDTGLAVEQFVAS